MKMNERIKKLTELTLNGDMFVYPVKTEFDREDLFLSRIEREVKRLCEYIKNQQPMITEYSKLTGFFRFDGSVVGDAFTRSGHKNTKEAIQNFYLKPIDNLSTMEWQHATGDYKKVLEKGINGIIKEIDESLKIHKREDETEFLYGIKKVAEALIEWAHICSGRVARLADEVTDVEHKKNLIRLSKALLNVPENKPSGFYEAVLSVYICFSADPDSLGTLDRYLTPFYTEDIKNGIIVREDAKEYLQELFLMIQATVSPKDYRFTRGAESHFCIGGYLPDGSDGFNEVSHLIVESLMELPIYIPQITLRWTEKTPHDVLRFMMDAERKDINKRIAFTNDEKRIKCYTEICGIPFERAVSYTMVGCNEPAFLGAITGGNSNGNILKSVETLFHKKSESIIDAKSFDEFYGIFENELFSDLKKIYDYDDKYSLLRARDINYLSSLFFNGCIEKAKSLTQGGGDVVIASPMLIGVTNVIDSLITVKQFVFDEKLLAMQELIDALKADWYGYEDMRTVIVKKGKFFGNDDDLSNSVAHRLYESFYRFLKDKRNVFGYHWLIGDLLGYNEHHKWFGEKTKATPDGRFAGDLLKFGICQSEGRDRNGLTALLNSVAALDKNAISCGSTVTNISLDEQLIKNDEYFDKTVDMFETYFKNGGIHFQLTYVSKEDLLAAKKNPENYGNLRVRVTGFSEYFVRLKDSIQDDIIDRTVQ